MTLKVKAVNIPHPSTGARTKAHKNALHEALLINRVNQSFFEWHIDDNEKDNHKEAVTKAKQAIADVDWQGVEVEIKVRQTIPLFII